jgi:hypothetical protein
MFHPQYWVQTAGGYREFVENSPSVPNISGYTPGLLHSIVHMNKIGAIIGAFLILPKT